MTRSVSSSLLFLFKHWLTLSSWLDISPSSSSSSDSSFGLSNLFKLLRLFVRRVMATNRQPSCDVFSPSEFESCYCTLDTFSRSLTSVQSFTLLPRAKVSFHLSTRSWQAFSNSLKVKKGKLTIEPESSCILSLSTLWLPSWSFRLCWADTTSVKKNFEL